MPHDPTTDFDWKFGLSTGKKVHFWNLKVIDVWKSKKDPCWDALSQTSSKANSDFPKVAIDVGVFITPRDHSDNPIFVYHRPDRIPPTTCLIKHSGRRTIIAQYDLSSLSLCAAN